MIFVEPNKTLYSFENIIQVISPEYIQIDPEVRFEAFRFAGMLRGCKMKVGIFSVYRTENEIVFGIHLYCREPEFDTMVVFAGLDFEISRCDDGAMMRAIHINGPRPNYSAFSSKQEAFQSANWIDAIYREPDKA